jgi:DNA-binding NtrC family response regulator
MSQSSSVQTTATTACPTVLVIDDDDGVVATLEWLLESEGSQIAVARDGTEGIAAYGKTLPDLVITDIIMPNETGIAVITSIKRINPAAKIIAISGGGRIGNMNFLEVAKEIGASTIVAKPFDAEELLGAVRSMLPTAAAVAAA